jgi:5-methylcytosine-specific restriction endonuclease McrA
MGGRIRRKLLDEHLSAISALQPEILICPLCQRPIPETQKDAHHLVPKSRGGTQTEFLHRICHRQIHALLTETELARRYHTVEALLSLPEIVEFVDWVRRKPPDFSEPARKSRRLRER